MLHAFESAADLQFNKRKATGELKRYRIKGPVDASSAYNGVARVEAERLGRADVVRFVHADFVSAAPDLPAATFVTLDRGVCRHV